MKKLSLALLAGSVLVFSSCSKSEQDDLSTDVSSESNYMPTVQTIEHDSYFFDVLHQAMSNSPESGNDSQPIYTNDINGDVVNPTGSTLRRSSNNISVNWSASDSPNLDVSGHAVTLWALIWDSADDAFGGMHPYAMYRVSGNVVGGQNKLQIGGSLVAGQTKDYYYTGPHSKLFENPETSFMVFISKSHGQKDPMYMPEQILTFGGGCDGDPDGGGPLAPCSEWLYAIHF